METNLKWLDVEDVNMADAKMENVVKGEKDDERQRRNKWNT